MASLPLTVREVLQNKCFEGAKVIAGEKGLDHAVRWVHIMEVTHVDKLLNGSELILSTGVGWRDFQTTSVAYLKQLIKARVAALCIELVKYANEIPEEMINLANKHDLPIIVFYKEVRFIDITQSINNQLMNNQYKILADLEDFSRKLNHTMLLPNAFHRVLKLIHQYLGVQVIYLSKTKEETIFVPLQHEMEQKKLLATVEKHKEKRLINSNKQYIAPNGLYVGQPVQALDHKFADLIIFPKYKNVTEYELLVLDRCANAISQDLVRIFYLEEQKKQQEQQWVQEWLKGECSKDEIHQYLSSLDAQLKPQGAVVCLCRFNQVIDRSNHSYFIAVFRNVLQSYGYYLISFYDQKQFVFIFINQRSLTDWKMRLQKAIDHINRMDMYETIASKHALFGVGKITEDMEAITASYDAAKEALHIQNQAKIKDKIFYEDLHVYRLVSSLNNTVNLDDYMNEYLGAVVTYDQAHNSELLYTLQIFLESNGSKNEAAKRLFVVRQTLYHRLDKLKELLGEDFMMPEKRVTIELLLHAYRYHNPSVEVPAAEVTDARG
ncbi:PucR family transcriptional regulator [Aquibacillus koreensis]|uniref:PucR family transcriptional regulator n=1 Tax=Aquibacillus koreensis TaxID=279446 RepID=A0A9X4ALJ0_9BACI|nr:PucR family transcriptional regulator [Aquibacillus koreensis]MCT2535363.1 PucR family transcriptional regulator [Aquibacillus koreensis]MDC3422528.1 PucR family transcriptional regulator [Aquibacillus koreensis]